MSHKPIARQYRVQRHAGRRNFGRSAFLQNRIVKMDFLLKAFLFVEGYLLIKSFDVLKVERIIYNFFLIAAFNFVMQMRGEGSSGVSRFGNFIPLLYILPRFDQHPAQVQIQGFNPFSWVVQFHAVPIGPDVPVGA